MPPLDHDRVHRLKARRPDLAIVINGGIGSLEEAAPHLGHVDGVMLGRAAYADPYLLAAVDRALYGANVTPPTRDEVLDQFLPYVERELARGVRLNAMTRHILGLYHGQPAGAGLPPSSRRERPSRRRRHRGAGAGAGYRVG